MARFDHSVSRITRRSTWVRREPPATLATLKGWPTFALCNTPGEDYGCVMFAMKPLRLISGLKITLASGFLLASLFAVSAQVTPVTVFDSFGPLNAYKTTVVWAVSGSNTTGGFRGQAEKFVPTISGTLSSFSLPTYRVSGGGRLSLFIAADSGLGVPGEKLESFPNVSINPNGIITFNSTTRPLLQAGLTYWLCAEPSDPRNVNGWYQNSIGYFPGFAYDRAAWDWAFVEGSVSPPSGAFRVNVVLLPEPAPFTLMSLAFFMMMTQRGSDRSQLSHLDRRDWGKYP
jgi:hypothetical protein